MNEQPPRKPDPDCPVCFGTGREDDGDRWLPCACLGDLSPKPTNSMILYFDVETTGKADMRAPMQAPHQPHIVQIAALLCDKIGNEVQSLNLIVKPDGYTIPTEASAIHGITQEQASEIGVSIKAAMNTFEWLCKPAKTFVAHNIDFDHFVCNVEFLRCFEDILPMPPESLFCTMKTMTDVCQIPGPYGYKWPKLIEAYRHCFAKDFDGAHDALADVRACKDVHQWITQNNLKTEILTKD